MGPSITDQSIREFGAVVRRIPGFVGVQGMSMDVYVPSRLPLAVQAHKARRERMLRMSMNAVSDRGIDLKRHAGETVEAPPAAPPKKYNPTFEPRWAAPSKALVTWFWEGVQPVEHWKVRVVLTLGGRPTIDKIQRVVAHYYGVNRKHMRSIHRTAIIVRPRQIAIYLARTLTKYSLPVIGKQFGNRDHSTILHAVRKIESLRAADRVFDIEMDALIGRLGGIKCLFPLAVPAE